MSAAENSNPGYQDTPLIPGTNWHVHDGRRPQPPIVTPGEASTAGKPGRPPSDAVALFDGGDLSKWRKENGEPAAWKVEHGYAEVVKGAGDIFTREEFGPDVQLHVEFATPTPAAGSGQGRGNSGVFLFGRYEIQVLDSHENVTYADGHATAIYGQLPPQVNASRGPGEWQTYDIIFSGPRFHDGKLAQPATVTVVHNGVVTQNHAVLIGDTAHRKVLGYQLHAEKGPVRLQDHGSPVRFRNVWIRELRNPGAGEVGVPQPAGK